MNLPEVCIRRKTLAIVMSLILVIFGIIGYVRLPVRELPDVDFPIVTVATALSGASPEIVEQDITDIIEEEVGTIEGIKNITSVSSEGHSVVTIEFVLDRNIDVAAQDVRDKVARARRDLPGDAEEPIVQKFDVNSFPIMWIAVSSESMSQQELSTYVDLNLKEQLQKVSGVGSVMLGGEKRFAVRLWLDSNKLAARKLTVDDVIKALKMRNIEMPAGRVEGINKEFSVKLEGDITTVAGFNEMVVAYKDGTPIRLEDVGKAEAGVENMRTLARYNGKPTVGMGVVKQSEANVVNVADGVKRALEKASKRLPPQMSVSIAYDSSEFVRKSIDEVRQTLLLAGILVVLTIFLFLRNVRSTIIPALAIPISIVATFAVMYFLGFTLNNFTLLALVLAIGVVVDDAIVMLENIFRHIEEGQKPFQAAIDGAKEIVFPIIATTVSLVAVFLPVAFMEGQVGRFFYEFGISTSVAVTISTFVSLTLTPMLCSRVLTHRKKHYKIYNTLEKGYIYLENHYKNLLRKTLSHRGMIIVIGAIAFGMSLIAFKVVGKEFVPAEDRGAFAIELQAPEGATLEYTDTYLKQIEAILEERSDIEGFFSALALSMGGAPEVNKGMLFVTLTQRDNRQHQEVILKQIRKQLAKITGADAYVISFSPFSRGMENRDFDFIITNTDFQSLQQYSTAFTQKLSETPGFIEVDTDLEINKPEVRIYVDRDKAASLGVSLSDIADNLNTLLAGNDYTKFIVGSERYEVILQMPKEDRATPQIISSINVEGDDDRLVELANIIDLQEGVGPSSINRYDRSRSVRVSANLQNLTLQEAVAIAEQYAAEILPDNFDTQLTGQAEEMRDSFASFAFTFALAVAIIYLVLSAQFDSFLYPLIVMGALPLSMIGALGALMIFGMTLNIYSIIGIIMLMGLVTKNSILLVDYTNTLRSRGVERQQAIQEAGKVRLRPILMTALSTILGIIPIAMGFGAGSEARRPMGAAVIGGMLTATLLTLLVVPALYSLLDDCKCYLRGKFNKLSPR
ncbi:MAG: efflux RND transporter permease subunit [Chlamydiota bacterium]